MKKKNRPLAQNKPVIPEKPEESISKRGKTVIGIGIGILILGFVILSQADPMGRNWASNLSPFLILGGYAFIGMGIFLPDPPPVSSSSTPPSGH